MFYNDEKQQQALDAFFSHFTKPTIDPLELLILSMIVEKSNQYGIFFSNDEIFFIIKEAFAQKKLTSFHFQCYSTIQNYFSSLVDHRFLYFDTKEQRFTLTKSGQLLGKSLLQLRNPEFLHYDEKYMVKLINSILNILKLWLQEIMNEKKKFYDEFEKKKLKNATFFFQEFLKNQQELMNFQEITIQIIDLSEISIKIYENLKKRISQFQEDYIKSMHEKRDLNHIKNHINGYIEDFQKKIEILNNKNQDIEKLVFKNEYNLGQIYDTSEKLNDEFKEIKSIALKYDSDINSNLILTLNKLIKIVNTIEDFSSQFDRTVYEVTSKRIDSIQNLFQYLKELMQNTQFLGDLYKIWKIGIYDIVNEVSTYQDKKNMNKPNCVDPFIESIAIGNYLFKFDEEDTYKKRNEEILRRNEQAKKFNALQIEKAKKIVLNSMFFDKLINKIINFFLNSEEFLNLNDVIYNLSKGTIFHFSHYFPLIISKFWQELSKREDLESLVKKEQGEVRFFINEYCYKEKKIIRVKAPLIKLKLKQ